MVGEVVEVTPPRGSQFPGGGHPYFLSLSAFCFSEMLSIPLKCEPR